MSQTLQPTPLGVWSKENIERASETILSLKAFRAEIATELTKAREFFVPNHKLDPATRKTKARRLKFFNQTSYALSLLTRHEYRLKNLSTVDGYLLAIDHHQPTVIYLMARYALELLATVNYINGGLESARQIDLKDWDGRGNTFLSRVCQAKYSGSDRSITDVLKGLGVSNSALKPIPIGDAIKLLRKTEFAPDAERDYDFLSNVCHHNGSGHELFNQSFRQTDRVMSPDGHLIIVPTASPAITLQYPSATAQRASLCQTAQLVLACAVWTDKILQEMPSQPFSDEEVAALTDGELSNSLNFVVPSNESRVESIPTKASVGRNDQCPCGSGKKFKKCCLM